MGPSRTIDLRQMSFAIERRRSRPTSYESLLTLVTHRSQPHNNSFLCFPYPRIEKAKNKLDTRHTSPTWPSPYACAQPYNPGRYQEAMNCFRLVRHSHLPIRMRWECSYAVPNQSYHIRNVELSRFHFSRHERVRYTNNSALTNSFI